jgi:hypothetical protein
VRLCRLAEFTPRSSCAVGASSCVTRRAISQTEYTYLNIHQEIASGDGE